MASVFITSPRHFLRAPNGGYYDPTTVAGYGFWERYLQVFDRAGLASRVEPTESVPDHLPRVDGPRLTIHEVPEFLGPWQYLHKRRLAIGAIRSALAQYDTFCLRAPCVVANLAWKELRRLNRPFGVEVVGDPWESLAPGGVKSLARPLARIAMRRALKAQCRTAAASAYVTRDVLQRRYPPAPGTFTTHYSSVELPAEAIADQARPAFDGARRLIHVGTLAVLYKGIDVLIEALSRLCRPDVYLTVLGDGRRRSEMEAWAQKCGVRDQIAFKGQLKAGQEVRRELDAADLFILPSRTEGLPRAMIEAMARGLPCIGTAVGGIPELLPPEDLVPPDDAQALADRIAAFLDDGPGMHAAAQRNLAAARDYESDTLRQRRQRFFEELARLA